MLCVNGRTVLEIGKRADDVNIVACSPPLPPTPPLYKLCCLASVSAYPSNMKVKCDRKCSCVHVMREDTRR